jgi:hypothetical protein
MREAEHLRRTGSAAWIWHVAPGADGFFEIGLSWDMTGRLRSRAASLLRYRSRRHSDSGNLTPATPRDRPMVKTIAAEVPAGLSERTCSGLISRAVGTVFPIRKPDFTAQYPSGTTA